MPEPVHASVVIATRNRSHLLPRLLGALEAQRNAPPFEVVVVDDDSTDDTADVLRRLADASALTVHVETQRPHAGQSAGRNRGWRRAAGDVVLFTDDDCVPGPDWVARLCRALDDVDIAQGRTVPAADQADNEGPFSRTLDIADANGWYATCNIGYRRGRLAEVEGFDESFRHFAGEDTDLALRTIDRGATFVFVDDAVVEHDIRPSSVRAALRGTWRWLTLPETVARHPSLAATCHSRRYWRETHVPTSVAVTGVAVALAIAPSTGRPVALATAAAAVAPYVNYRLRRAPVTLDRPRRIALLPATFLVDATEFGVLVLGSIRARRLLL